jgi:hypothetical protein
MISAGSTGVAGGFSVVGASVIAGGVLLGCGEQAMTKSRVIRNPNQTCVVFIGNPLSKTQRAKQSNHTMKIGMSVIII